MGQTFWPKRKTAAIDLAKSKSGICGKCGGPTSVNLGAGVICKCLDMKSRRKNSFRLLRRPKKGAADPCMTLPLTSGSLNIPPFLRFGQVMSLVFEAHDPKKGTVCPLKDVDNLNLSNHNQMAFRIKITLQLKRTEFFQSIYQRTLRSFETVGNSIVHYTRYSKSDYFHKTIMFNTN